MSQFVTDTHPLIWHLTQDRRLPTRVRQIFIETDAGLHQILIPGIALIEMVYLTEKGILPQPYLEQLLPRLEIPNGSYQVAHILPNVVQTMVSAVSWSAIPELADRIIAATARTLNLPLLTKDECIQKSNSVTIIW